MRVLVTLDGAVRDPEAPALRVDDLGLLRGDGVFETVLVFHGVARELDVHLDRFERSAASLDLPRPDRAAFARCAKTVVQHWRGATQFALKLVHTRGVDGGDGTPTGFVLGTDIAASVTRLRESGVSAVTLERGIEPGLAERAPWLLLGAKSLSYAVNMAALREAERRGANEVIFTASDGSVLEGPTSSVVLAEGHTLRTPAPQVGILPGTTQAALFRAAEKAGWSTKSEPVAARELPEADAVLLVSSVRGITRVRTLDGIPLADASVLARDMVALYESEYR